MAKTQGGRGGSRLALMLGGMVAMLVGVALGWWVLGGGGSPSQAADLVVYKSPTCGCCTGWVEHLRQAGFRVAVENVADVTPLKRQLGVPEAVTSCHTATMGRYVVEGHVPVEDLRRLQREQPDVLGIAAPGMPVGSPGMEVPGEPAEPYRTVTFTRDGRVRLFASH